MNAQTPTRSSASGLFRRGIRVVARYVREEPRTFALISVTGASLYAAATVGATIVLGRVTEKVILPAFDGGVIEAHRDRRGPGPVPHRRR